MPPIPVLQIQEQTSCLKRARLFRLFLSKPITKSFIQAFPTTSQLFWYEKGNLGFFRFTLGGQAVVSGIPQKKEVMLLYPLPQEPALAQELEALFSGFHKQVSTLSKC